MNFAAVRTLTPAALRRFGRPAAAGAILPLLSACSGPYSTLDPAGPVAASVANLWWVMFAGATALLALVVVLLTIAFVRPGAGRSTPESYWLVGGGLILPAVVLTPLLIYALLSGNRLFADRERFAAEVDVLARQWQWVFTYRTADGAVRRSFDVLHIPAGQPVRLNITSADVIHSFWVPRLAGKIDAIPGHTTVLRLTADAPGRYHGLCAEFCGTAHLEMQKSVQAHESMAAFRAAVDALARDGDNKPAERSALP